MNILVPIAISFIITVFVLPYWIKRAKTHKLVSIDVHKPSRKVAELADWELLSEEYIKAHNLALQKKSQI